MHLSDNEIFQQMQIKQISDQHLANCEDCQFRLNNRIAFQNKLNQTYQSADFEMHWDRLAGEFEQTQHRLKQLQMESKIKKLQISLIALAACLCLVVLVPLIATSKLVPSVESELALLIDENHQLQRSVELATPYGALQTVSASKTLAFQTLKMNLQQIDNEIQLSYLDELPNSEKLKLWKARKQLLVNSIETLNSDLPESAQSI
jgi:hypothetical protein